MDSSAAPPPMPNGERSQRTRYQQSIDYLYGLINYEKLTGRQDKFKFRLNRMRELLRRLDLADLVYEPPTASRQVTSAPRTIPTVHLAGTKGKGSTATMIAAMLTASGFRTGLYTSPHVHDLEERFRVDGENCSRDALTDLVDAMRDVCEAMKREPVGAPTFFEITTAMALLHFRRSDCDAQVLEVGLGGRLDSTNVVRPSLSIITSIGLDHQHVLGNTLAEIAGEKAGILKPGVPVISGVRDDGDDSSAADVITRVATETGCPLDMLGRDFDIEYVASHDWGSKIRVVDDQSTDDPFINLGVEGSHQAYNASLAVRAIGQLARLGITNGLGQTIDELTARETLASLDIIGRLERFELPNGQTAIIDTAHNEDSIEALVRCLRYRFRDREQRRLVIVFGSSRDKDAAAMLTGLQSVADRMVLTRFHGNPRYQPIDELKRVCAAQSLDRFDTSERPADAIELAKQVAGPGGVIVVCGSFFLADEIRRTLPH